MLVRSITGDCASTEVDPTIAESGVRNSCETEPINASRRLSACARSRAWRTVTAMRPVMAATVMNSIDVGDLSRVVDAEIINRRVEEEGGSGDP